jgi:F1F0 ATPase subunit 2
MNDVGVYTLALLLGAGLGLFFFGGLWLTIRKLEDIEQPALVIIGSFLIRTVVVLAGLYLVAGGHWQRLAVAVLGFAVVRIVMVRSVRPTRAWGKAAKTRAAKS